MELLVALSVFSVLLVIMMQFFSSARQVTSAAEKKSQTYTRVRTALDMVSNVLKNSYHQSDVSSESTPAATAVQWDGAPFMLRNNASHGSFSGSAILFPAKSPYRVAGNSDLMYVGIFGLNTNADINDDDFGELRMAFFPDTQTGYVDAWPPLFVNGTGPGTVSGALSSIWSTLAGNRNAAENASNANLRFVLLKNVVAFEFAAYRFDSSDGEMQQINTGDYPDRLKRPYAIELRLSVLNEDDFLRYKEMLEAVNANASMANENAAIREFREQNQHTFNRFIFLNSRLEE